MDVRIRVNLQIFLISDEETRPLTNLKKRETYRCPFIFCKIWVSTCGYNFSIF